MSFVRHVDGDAAHVVIRTERAHCALQLFLRTTRDDDARADCTGRRCNAEPDARAATDHENCLTRESCHECSLRIDHELPDAILAIRARRCAHDSATICEHCSTIFPERIRCRASFLPSTRCPASKRLRAC